jgi:hypothetical protein
VIQYVELTPTIAYLPKGLRNKCKGLIRQHSMNNDTREKTVLDMDAYVAQLEEKQFRDVVGA